MTGMQWVCEVCGYNMIGEMPDICPFCGARHDKFVTWEEAERTYRVTRQPLRNHAGVVTHVLTIGEQVVE